MLLLLLHYLNCERGLLYSVPHLRRLVHDRIHLHDLIIHRCFLVILQHDYILQIVPSSCLAPHLQVAIMTARAPVPAPHHPARSPRSSHSTKNPHPPWVPSPTAATPWTNPLQKNELRLENAEKCLEGLEVRGSRV